MSARGMSVPIISARSDGGRSNRSRGPMMVAGTPRDPLSGRPLESSQNVNPFVPPLSKSGQQWTQEGINEVQVDYGRPTDKRMLIMGAGQGKKVAPPGLKQMPGGSYGRPFFDDYWKG